MFKTVRGRIITTLALIVVCAWQLYDHYQESCNRGEDAGCVQSPIKLGLDLQGGMHLVLEVDDSLGTMTPEARADAIDRVERVIRTRIDELGVEEPLIQKSGSERLIVELAGISDQQRARDIVQQAAFLEFKLVLPTSELQSALARMDRAIVAAVGVDSLQVLGRAVEAPDQTDDVAALLFGGDTTEAAADSAGAQDQEEPEANLRPFTSLLLQGDGEGIYLVAVEDMPQAELFLAMPEVRRTLPRNVELHWGAELVGQGARTYRRLYVLEDEAFLTGESLETAQAARDPQYNTPQVRFELDRRGGRDFARFTGQHVGDFLAIVLDGEVMSAPVIRDRIGASGQIDLTGAPMEEANDLALVLRAGALPAPLRIMEERTVGPSLGAGSIEQGETAGLVGVILVLFIMIGYYRMAGVLAVGALMVYVVIILGGLAAFNATLTLPGIAGLILSVGMAVDANVLIFERIREELEAGRATRTAVDEGFGHALSAIVDANLTTLITALILFQFGTGPVRGFAVTLSIGIVASFVSALYVTRTFFLLYLQGKKASDPISI
ncbi:MAG: protein translocase subunit SecD [Gemmatimonadales bacterium]|jgi:preprotein translocase subunit SecD|nr:MAG: protein translocase subunit SecD [Gemmatimonadales bacterium]